MLGFWGIFQQNPPSIPKYRVDSFVKKRVPRRRDHLSDPMASFRILLFWNPSYPNFQKHQHLVTSFFLHSFFFSGQKRHCVFFQRFSSNFLWTSQVCLHRTTPRLSKCLSLWLHPCGAWCHHWTLRPWRCQAERLEVTASHAATQAEELPTVSGGNRFSRWLTIYIYTQWIWENFRMFYRKIALDKDCDSIWNHLVFVKRFIPDPVFA